MSVQHRRRTTTSSGRERLSVTRGRHIGNSDPAFTTTVTAVQPPACARSMHQCWNSCDNTEDPEFGAYLCRAQRLFVVVQSIFYVIYHLSFLVDDAFVSSCLLNGECLANNSINFGNDTTSSALLLTLIDALQVCVLCVCFVRALCVLCACLVCAYGCLVCAQCVLCVCFVRACVCFV